ncbi:hypothetical protein DA102_002230 [Sinorhizobium meliloti]|nr:hypothetical protein DA102_002230 [Sinorhizobium meliloti]
MDGVSDCPALLDDLVSRLLQTGELERKERVRREAVLSHVYSSLSPSSRRDVLDWWYARAGGDAMRRWMKAISNDAFHFSLGEVRRYWETSKDDRAAQILVDKGQPEEVAEFLPYFIQVGVPGWLLSRATLKATNISELTWSDIRRAYPVSYLYLCAKTARAISDDDAIEILKEADPLEQRGLAIWSVGQLGRWHLLEQIEADFDLPVQ